ncbi:hypothetical protein GLW08_08055 [Pontibacillus yanchengensis]|uniref:Uncharacterized protein n=1 Tax=Pontibacillus yanchengensis TaxID=462910 RepID=A0ACC7VET8_9BACI|nr:ATP-binding protein [Pontibacillus yanchengensis]MYL53292.1 hypothetical protein [Pontibacillus yanchengensis]
MKKTNTFIQKNKIYFIPIIFLLLSIYLITVILKYPYIGVTVDENPNNQWVVSDIAPHSWADKNNIKEGTVVELIDGVNPGEYSTVQLFETVEKASTITMHLNESTTFTQIEEEVSLDQWLFYIIFPSVFMVIMLLLSVFILIHKKHSQAGQKLILFFLALGLAYLAGSGTARGEYISSLINTFMFLSTPALLLQFIDHYFKELNKTWFSSRIYQFMIVMVIVITVIEAIFFFIHVYPNWYASFISVTFVLFALLAFSVIFKGFFIYKESEYAPILQYLIFGLVSSFVPFTFFSLIPQYLFGVTLLSAEIALLFLLTLPLTFIYLISAQRLFDIDFVIGRVRYYAYVSIIPTVLLLLIIMIVVDYDWHIKHVFQLFFSIINVLIVFLYIKEIFDFRIQRNLFAEKNNYHQSLQRFVQEMKKETNAIDLFKRLKRELIDVIGVENIFIYSKNTISNYYCVYYPIDGDLMAECEQRVRETNAEAGTLVNLKVHEGYVLIIGHTISKITYLYCSEKPNKTVLNIDEKAYLQTMAYNTHIALENLLLIEDLFQELQHMKNDDQQKYPSWLSRLLFSLSDNQRKQIAVDLHDSVLQEQLYIYRQMDDFINRYHDQLLPEVLDKLILFKEQMLDNIHLIRETCNELRPPFLEELGLVASLGNLINQYQLRSNFTVQFDSSKFQAELDNEYILGIYRIVQELLTNAMKHSKADKVLLILKNNEENVELQYMDNGVGMDMDNKVETFSHMGLSGIEQRVNGLNGQFQVETKPNEGFRLTIIFYKATMNDGRGSI